MKDFILTNKVDVYKQTLDATIFLEDVLLAVLLLNTIHNNKHVLSMDVLITLLGDARSAQLNMIFAITHANFLIVSSLIMDIVKNVTLIIL